jgi:8-oxo-dGTP diphosphatase
MTEKKEVLHVVGAIILAGDRLLACKRAPHKASAGLWEFPGGKVETGEVSETALLREILEELSLGLESLELFDISDTQVGEQIIRLETFLCVPKHDFAGQSTDHDEFRWLSHRELDAVSWALPDIPAVNKLRQAGF